MLIIDNSCLSFAFNIGNGVPILPFYDSQTDEEMRHLTYYLNCLIENIRSPSFNDVREYNDDAFGLLKLKDAFHNKSVESRTSAESIKGGHTHASSVNSAHVTSKDYLLCEPVEMKDHLYGPMQTGGGFESNKNVCIDVIEERVSEEDNYTSFKKSSKSQ